MKAQKIYENVENILKPKDNVYQLKTYFLDVLQEMLNVGFPKMSVSNIQDAFTAYESKYIERAFNEGLTPKEAAYKILNNILDGVKNFKY